MMKNVKADQAPGKIPVYVFLLYFLIYIRFRYRKAIYIAIDSDFKDSDATESVLSKADEPENTGSKLAVRARVPMAVHDDKNHRVLDWRLEVFQTYKLALAVQREK